MHPAGGGSHEDAMLDPSDTRDIGPRIGSPFWIYLTVVTAAGLGALLVALPVAEVKIAPSFVSGLASSPDSQVIVRSLVDLVRGLGIRSVAEGVETADVAAALLAMGCDAAQGHAFSRPLNAAAATRWLADDLAVQPAPAARREPPVQPAAAAPAPVTSAAAPEVPGR